MPRIIGDTPRPLWRLRMAAHARDRRADLDRRLDDLKAAALAAFDEGLECLASVHVRTDRHGTPSHSVTVMSAPVSTPSALRRAV